MKPELTHKNLRLLLVEDDYDFCNSVAEVLHDYQVEVFQAWDGEQGYALYLDKRPHIILSDIVMPKMDGFELVRKIRMTDTQTPIILMSGLCLDGKDVCKGMSMGANDYIRPKPFSYDELIARINNCRIKPAVYFGNSCYEAISCTLTVNGYSVQLTRTQAVILSLLTDHVDEVVYRKEIHKYMGDYLSFWSRSPDMCIKKLRELLKDDSMVEISTCKGRGYMLKNLQKK